DHGKSTLADRMLEVTHVLDGRVRVEQVLDSMELEKERGITIKSQTVCMEYKAKDGNIYHLNLIDTPGHVDFSYEVSRSLSSCEGAVLLIDASQGVEAQTLANMYQAVEHNLTIIPAINKIDLPNLDMKMIVDQIEHDLGFFDEETLRISAKAGTGIEDLLEEIVKIVPSPSGNPAGKLSALIFDSKFDPYRGVIITTRIIDGILRKGDNILLMHAQQKHKVDDLGLLKLDYISQDSLTAGEVGYIVAGIKNVSDIKVGDTITLASNPVEKTLKGYKEVKPMVFASIYPLMSDDYAGLKGGIEKLKLNDASLLYEPDSSLALGFGFRCGFLGLLHLEIVQERLEREFNLNLLVTSPTVKYEVYLTDGTMELVDNPVKFPDPQSVQKCMEPFVHATILVPKEYMGNIINLCLEKRGTQKNTAYLDEKRIQMEYDLPLSEIVYDFYDRLKSVSRGYASFDYEISDYRETKLEKLDILVNAKQVDALSQLVNSDLAYFRGRHIVSRLRELIPRHQFKVPLQATIGGRIIARETISALRKNVTAKCYGGDISRKRKLLEKQREGKKRMKTFGNVQIPQSAFTDILKTGD
ncbi:MAG: translation elongation factor 4, partial [Spirochaetes bacterium]|nr:translation elongation factor 4 [Spirochaetota bacterium]